MKMDEIIEKYVCKPSRIAVAGASSKKDRAVYGVMEYLEENGFRLFPVNPACVGEKIHGLDCIASISEIKDDFDVLALFISPSKQQPVLDDLEGLDYKPVVWMQPGAENDDAEALLKRKGYEIVKGACLMMIHQVYCHDQGA